VTGDSSSDAFLELLTDAGVDVMRICSGRDAFDHAERLLQLCRQRHADTIVFWNVDAKVKLLVAKLTRGWRNVRRIDVSPGGYAFEEMDATAGFRSAIGFSDHEYYECLSRLVLKYHASVSSELVCRTQVIRNGVGLPARAKRDYRLGTPPRIVASGRIAPSKFVLEMIDALVLLREHCPRAQL